MIAPRSESPAPSLTYLSAPQASSSSSHTPSPLSISSTERDVETTSRKSPPLAMSPTEESFPQPSLPTPIPARSDSLSVSSTPTASPSTATRSAKPTSPNESADPVLGAWQSQGPPRSAPQPPQPQMQAHSQNAVVLTPATPEREPRRSQAPVTAPSPEVSRAANGPFSNGRSSSPSRPPPINPPPPSQPVSITLNDNSTLAVGRQGASRDSQISLPEEAKRYYATMASPAVSPGMKFNFAAEPNSPLKQETRAADGPPSSQPEMNGSRMNGAVPTGVGLGLPTNGTLTPEGRGRVNGRVPGSRAGSVTTEEGAEFLDMEDEDSAYETGASSAQYASYEGTPPRGSEDSFSTDRRREKTKSVRPVPAVEDFPLPPGTSMPPAQAQQQYTRETPPAAQAHMGTPSRQGSLADSGRDSRPSMSTSDSHTYQAPSFSSSQTAVKDQQPPPSPFPLPIPANPPQMKFRALPLLAEDLPYTEIAVANSSIRPNDRGKEVLSFIISIDPGRGKESWRVEKHYSDVLSLDGRVRNAVGRSAAKKLATLPEGRLWRDHAPAKVDQRKVRQ